MAISNIFPHVGITYKAKKRNRYVTAESNAPVLFAPIVADKGPVNTPYTVYSNAEFIETFGALDFSTQGQQLLNIGNWLNSGGAVMVYNYMDITSDASVSTSIASNTNSLGVFVNTWKQDADKNVEADKYYYTYNGVLLDADDNATYKSSASFNASVVASENYKTAYEEVTWALLPKSYDTSTSTYKYNNTGTNYYTYDTSTSKYLLLNTSSTVNSTTTYYKDGGTYVVPTGAVLSSNASISSLTSSTSIYDKRTLKEVMTDLACAFCVDSKGDAIVRAKYPGKYYENLTVEIEQTGKEVFTVKVLENDKAIESFIRRTPSNYDSIQTASSYIGFLRISDNWFAQIKQYTKTNSKKLSLKLGKSDITGYTAATDIKKTIDDAFKNAFDTNLKDKLQYKCDYILDAGFSQATQQTIIENVAKTKEAVRDDIIFITDDYELTTNGTTYTNALPSTKAINEFNDQDYEARLVAEYTQFLTTEDIYSNGDSYSKEVYVTPTYFLAGLIPQNELSNGFYEAVAGKKRGEIKDAIYLNENPLSSTKDNYYQNRINYIEKDSEGFYFMSQSTKQTEDTTLRFLNHSRSLNVISREIEKIGRYYLHEQNTVSNLSRLEQEITVYLNDLVQKRALSKGYVEVYADEYDDTEVHVILNIAFPGTIEIISVEINID